MRYRFTPAGDPATAQGRSCHEDRHSPPVQRHHGDVWLREYFYHSEHRAQRHHPRRGLLGKQKILDTGGRVARFEKRFGKNPTGQKPDSKQPDSK